MSSTNQSNSFLPAWARRSLLSLLVLVVLLILIRLCLPLSIKLGATYWLETQNLEASIGDIEISLFNGRFAVNDVSVKNQAGKGFTLGRVDLAWQWQPLFNHEAIVDQIEIDALHVDAAIIENGDMNIAGLPIKAATTEAPTKKTGQSAAIPWGATINNIVLSDIEFCLQRFVDTKKPVLDYCGKLAALNWAGKISFKPSTQTKTAEALPLYAQGDLHVQEIAFQNNQLKLALLNIGSVDMISIELETPDHIRLDKIDVTKFAVLQRAAKTSPADAQVFAFDQLDIQPVKLSQLKDLNLGSIKINEASSYLLIDKEGNMDFAQWLPAKQESIKDETKDSTETTAETFHYAFDEFVFKTRQHFIFIDDSLKETFTADIHDIEMNLTKLDSNNPDDMSQLSLALTINKHGSLKLDAEINPLSKKPSLKGKGKIAGLDLRMIAPITRQHVGHDIKSGQLDASLKLDIDKGVINSNIALALHQFKLESLSNEEASELNSDFGFPLSSSLSLIRDRDNAIRLDIPVTGDIENPEFDPRDAIIKASSSAITAAVIQYYTPFGLVFAVESLFDLATALHFEPVLFEAGQAELTPAHIKQLDTTASLMNKRPGIHLTLCGISNKSDKDELFPELAEAATGKQDDEDSDEPLSKENTVTLKQLAESRSTLIKNYLVNEKTVKASRLIECAPVYSDDGIPGVEISI